MDQQEYHTRLSLESLTTFPTVEVHGTLENIKHLAKLFLGLVQYRFLVFAENKESIGEKFCWKALAPWFCF